MPLNYKEFYCINDFILIKFVFQELKLLIDFMYKENIFITSLIYNIKIKNSFKCSHSFDNVK